MGRDRRGARALLGAMMGKGVAQNGDGKSVARFFDEKHVKKSSLFKNIS